MHLLWRDTGAVKRSRRQKSDSPVTGGSRVRWQWVLDGSETGAPLFAQIAEGVSGEISRGRLQPGAKLPSTRGLAQQLQVNRNTVVAAYRELLEQGWITSERARGYFVHGDIDASRRNRSRARATGDTAGYRLTASVDPRFGGGDLGIDASSEGAFRYHLSGGRPDPRLMPTELLARAYRRALRTEGRKVLDYGSPYGHPRLRTALAEMLASVRALPITADEVLVTRGSQMAIDLTFASLISAGQRVAVEAYGYPPAWAAMRRHGAQLCPVEVDAEGMRVHDLPALHQEAPLRAIYLTPHHQYPTTHTLSPARRLWLLEFARRERIAIVEDDYDHEFHYQGRPVLPLASRDPSRQVIYVGSLSKVLAPGLRIGYAVAPPAVLAQMAQIRTHVDRQGDLATELALAELMEDGEVQRHVWRVRRAYETRRAAFVRALERHLPDVISAPVPAGGIALWGRVAPGISPVRWAEAGAVRGVRVTPGTRLRVDGRASPYLRLGFARHTEAELAAGVRALAAALEDL